VSFILLDLNLSLSAKIASDFALDSSACATGIFSIALDDSACAACSSLSSTVFSFVDSF
jgi:hypothetical protein